MALRIDGWRSLALAAACVAAASAPEAASAQSLGQGAGQGGRLVWGGRMPLPGEAYVPSVPRRDARGANDPVSPDVVTSDVAAPDVAAPDLATPGVAAPQGVPRADERLLIEDLLGRPPPAPIQAQSPAPDPALAPAEADAGPPPMEPPVSVDAGETGGLDGEGAGDDLGDDIGNDPGDGPGNGLRDDPAAGEDAGQGPVEASLVFPNTLPDRGRDPWEGLKRVTTGAAEASPDAPDAPDAVYDGEPDATPSRKTARPRGRVASLGREAPPESLAPGPPGRGRLEAETPSGYRAMPRQDALCRAYLRQNGVKFVDAEPVGNGRSCRIAHPVKIYEIAPGVAMKPAALLNCGAAARISQWVRKEVEPAARWKMWTGLKSVLNASSYRCSRIAGSHTISEHASGNALDVAGFEFTDGDTFDVERKGFFSFRSKAFQKAVRHSACRYFGTVLGPGYNFDHRSHLHLDARNRRSVVCK